jgi:hypothetical protein
MKLTRPEAILDSEKEFIDTINAELNWDAIETLLMEKYRLTLQEEVDYKNGDLIVYDNQIAYRFDFEVRVPLSIIFNREGDCLDLSTTREGSVKDGAVTAPDLAALRDVSEEKVEQLASNIASMISEINEGGTD